MSTQSSFYSNLIQSLCLVAAGAAHQIKALHDFVRIPAEIALTYYDSFLQSDRLVRDAKINPQQMLKLQELDTHFSMMGNNPALWTLEAVVEAPEWEQARRMAKEALTLLGREACEPDLSWITFIGTHI
jgi:hypothetical protein